jgi:DNA-binding MarR family transcriptional regulator
MSTRRSNDTAGSGSRPIQESRERHVGRLLLQAQRAFNSRAVSELRQRGYDDLTLAHLTILPYIDAEGSRITTLAEQAGITKQGMGQLIADLERKGYVARRIDPTDRRATLVSFTPSGMVFLRDALAVIDQIEAEFAALLGAQQFDALRAALTTIVARADG